MHVKTPANQHVPLVSTKELTIVLFLPGMIHKVLVFDGLIDFLFGFLLLLFFEGNDPFQGGWMVVVLLLIEF